MDDISVLICDDSALMRNLISRIIDGTEGMTVVGKAPHGRAALDMLDSVKPDVIVLDIEMPIMNGIEFLKARSRPWNWARPTSSQSRRAQFPPTFRTSPTS